MTKMFALGALGLLGAGGVFAGARKIRRRRALRAMFAELRELDEPVVIAEEILVVTDPYAVELELIPLEEATESGSR